MPLAAEHCRDLPKGSPALPPAEAQALAKEVPRWQITHTTVARSMRFKDFAAALAFANEVGKVAEAEGHHPDLHLTGYRDLKVELSTHSVGGLSRNDFILAAKVDALPGAPH